MPKTISVIIDGNNKTVSSVSPSSVSSNITSQNKTISLVNDNSKVTVGAATNTGTGRDLTFLHNQIAMSDIWPITHNLGKFPSVTIIDSAGDQVEGDITYIDINSLVISFSAPFSGKASLN